MMSLFRDRKNGVPIGHSDNAAGTRGQRRHGSALLIVLGFLSFMMISGVSFAIYMRIERQASSNYRHATTARHLLNAALYRAMDEVDSELRVKTDSKVIGFNEAADSGNVQVKFPKWKDWPGRVKVSACDDDDDNDENAHVLSLESLSFLPAFLINDVRRFAVWDKDTDSSEEWRGAKWRSLTRATDGVKVGRYAYACVNISDMLNVNLCRAQMRDSYTNRVTVGHLFANDTERENFDNNAQKDIYYFSLQDFYSARYLRNRTQDSSPYHSFLNAASPSFNVFERSDNLDHLFCADSIVRPEPMANNNVCNLTVNPPIEASALATEKATTLTLNTQFKQAVNDAFTSVDASYLNQVMPFLLADYIDTDSLPKGLHVPSVEMVPMISQIIIDNNDWAPKITTRTEEVGDPAHSVTYYSVQLFGALSASSTQVRAPIYVEVVWPFKDYQARLSKPSFTIEVEAYLQLHPKHAEKKTTSFQVVPSACISVSQMAPKSIGSFWTKTVTSQSDCYEGETVVMQANKSDITKDIVDTDGNLYNSFVNGQEFSVSLIVFAQIKTGNKIVDRVPQMFPYPGSVRSIAEEFNMTPKLFFQTAPKPVQTTMSGTLDYAWTGLEVADPRFNYRASDWIKSTDTASTYVGVNTSTTALLGKEGRDADIFMSVSDAGYLQSPGELGFIIRPFPYVTDAASGSWDFRTATEPRDKDYMFRTIRLYDHGAATGANYAQDDIYGHFYMMNRDGTVPGARVNPLSDIPEVLEGAIFKTPLNYWLSSTNNTLSVDTRKQYTFDDSTKGPLGSNWDKFRDAWADAVIDAVTEDVNTGSRTAKVNQEYKSTLSDVYGKTSVMKWYSDNSARTEIFTGLTLSKPLYEIDRKMLYSFSLDSFSDRQQLFLYFIRAEATASSFGAGVRSLAGGRAVALVWRDPYPYGYDKEKDLSGSTTTRWSRKTGNNGWYPGNSTYVSPWCQYYSGRSEKPQRWDSYHETRILFFKQLDQ